MSSNTTRHIEGLTDKVVGKVKKTIGAALDNEQMETEGKLRELEGEAKIQAVEAAERTKGKVEEVTGAIKRKVGEVLDNEQMQIEGAVREKKGELRQGLNEAKR